MSPNWLALEKVKNMEKDDQKSFPIGKAYDFAKDNGLGDQGKKIQDLEFDGVPQKRERIIRKGYLIRLFGDHGIYSGFITKYWPYGATTDGKRRREYCVKLADEYRDSDQSDNESDGEGILESAEFAIEAHLRDFLAKGNNLSQIEPGLHLYKFDDKAGVEYVINNGRIDILAVDLSGGLVVIELKLRQGRNKALGQLLYYMGWIDHNIGTKTAPCRGLIVANDIPEELKIAVSQVPRVTLARYKMNFSIEHV